MLLNKAIFQRVGTVGATVILLSVYAVSLLYITNFQLKDWAKEMWQKWKLRRIDRSAPLAEEEVELTKKEDELSQRLKELEDLQRKLEATQTQVEQTAQAAEETVAAAQQDDPRIIDLSQPGAQAAQAAEDEEDDTSAKRQLAAIMFTDIAGYSRLANHDEKEALKLIRKQRRLLKPIVKKYEGEWLKDILVHPLVQYSRENENLLITPHIGGATFESINQARIFMAKKVADYLREKA